jgi:hypothetical protein
MLQWRGLTEGISGGEDGDGAAASTKINHDLPQYVVLK